MKKLQLILGVFIIGLAIGAGIHAFNSGQVSNTTFYIWLGTLIISRLHIIVLEMSRR